MNQSALISTLVVLVFGLVLPQSEAVFYNDNLGINSRIPGDELILQSHAVQNLDFFAKVSIEIRYPEQLPHSNYVLSHLSVNGKDNTGYIDARFDQGGPGEDFMHLKVFFNSIKNGDFQIFVYGKKK